MGLLGSLFRSSKVLGIAEEALQFGLRASEQTHPNEYMGLLRGTEAKKLGLDQTGQVITDILVIPGTESGNTSATLKTNKVPNDRKSVGSIHSHPSGVLTPSSQDLQTFTRGEVHIIVGSPYQRHSWQAYDASGKQINLKVIDVELPDSEEFFHFDESDLDIDDAGEQ